MRILRDVICTQAKGCHICIQIGSTAFLFGRERAINYRLEILTHLHIFRFTKTGSGSRTKVSDNPDLKIQYT